MQYRSVDISSDELSLLVSSPGIAGQAVVMHGFRASTDDDFQDFEQIPTLNVDLENTGAKWNKQEDEISLTSNRVIDGSDFDLYVVLPAN